MARLDPRTSTALRGAALLLALALAACGKPQAADPLASPARAEAEPELLGAPASETAASLPALAAAPPPQRPGWGTMAPIPNPEDGGSRFARTEHAPYRLIGPTLTETQTASAGPSIRTDNGPRNGGRVRVVIAEPSDASAAKARVRHWIIPAAQR
jgi:hypothetical protein